MRNTTLLAVFYLFSLALAAPFNHVHRRLARVLQAQDASQTSLTLDKSQVQTGLKKDGQQDPDDGQVASLTSGNNFINFCLTQKSVPLTNGAQVKDGSCNPTVMGRILAENAMPASKFFFPVNLDSSIEENETFTVKMAVKNLQTGHFVNAKSNYFAAPSQVNDQGHLIGHSHVVIQPIPSINSTAILDPTKFAFFQGLNAKAVDGILSTNVTKGLPAGTYRLGSINTAANHQPALVSVAQHGMLDDIVYFTVKKVANSKIGKNDSGSAKAVDADPTSKSTSLTRSKTSAATKAQPTPDGMNGKGPLKSKAVRNALRSASAGRP